MVLALAPIKCTEKENAMKGTSIRNYSTIASAQLAILSTINHSMG